MSIDWTLARDAQLLCDTAQAGPGHMETAWKTVLTELIGPHEILPIASTEAGGEICCIERGLMKIAKISMTPQTLNRRPQDIAQKHSPFDNHQNIMLIGISGQINVTVPESSFKPVPPPSIGQGDYIICRSWLPYKIEAAEPCEAIVISMPGWWLNHRPPPRGVTNYGLRVPANSALAPIFESALNVVLSESSNDVNGQAIIELFGEILTYSMNVAYLSHSNEKISYGKGPKVLNYILRNFPNEELSPQSAAAELKCSLSTIHKSCATFGTTFNQMVINLRLSMACHLLWLGHLNVSQIAYEVGFKEVSHFNRTFKKKYLVNPSEFKKSFK